MKFLGLIVTTAIAGTSAFAPVSRTFVNRDGELFPVRKYLRLKWRILHRVANLLCILKT
jgi:hypothetical protein